ncbi:hypothetical protein BFN03_14535 [Rhodococcus sp. WMMA185]|uniref:hypothetical protein n=1 Tax=Rhodococcus sp. WMMA185 TaxID=679318 RepID=UPI000877F56E|nr:hypothetical protein [Rhodococcus sp. WMMA185]AOW93456.1 hypothetical protein BFN03_14535 [Rhodococcus sp. WMMA185]
MKRTITAVALSTAALVLGACSNSDTGSSNSVPTAELGKSQTVKGDGWEAEITVSDLITREMDYYGEIKPDHQYRAAVSVRSISGETPLYSNAFKAVLVDGRSMNLSIGGESDDIDTTGEVPAGHERSGMVTWTGEPGLEVKEISYLADGMFPAATWTATGLPESAPPSRMPNHDEVVATKTQTPTAAAGTPTAPSETTSAATTEADAAPSSDVSLGQACDELTTAMGQLGTDDPQVILELMQTSTNWTSATPDTQASYIEAAQMIERGDC